MAPISPNRMNWKAQNFSGPYEETVASTYVTRNDRNGNEWNVYSCISFLDRIKINLCLHMEIFVWDTIILNTKIFYEL